LQNITGTHAATLQQRLAADLHSFAKFDTKRLDARDSNNVIIYLAILGWYGNI